MVLCLVGCFFISFCWVFYYYYSYFKRSETSRDSVGHFGLNSLALLCSRSLPPSRSLLLSLKEAAFL